MKFIKNSHEEHHVILNKYGEDMYIDETTIKSGYPDEKGRIENVIYIAGNLTGSKNKALILTQSSIVELRNILEIIIDKERYRIGSDESWGRITKIIKCEDSLK